MTIPNEIQQQILKYEGSSFTNDPNDPGGATKYGWTLKTYQNIYPSATIDDIKNLTQEAAMALYEQYWWDKYGASQVISIPLAATLLLAQINMGSMRPNKLLQQLCNEFGDYSLVVDGILGPASIAAINNCAYIAVAFGYILFHDLYMPLINNGMSMYKNGWRNRVLANE